mmetsp:Transcript_1981/g.2643  ORF Transcript_1981/g.2643 Transcript_1981/m.2643 type:complete len:81 (-) Transcript_1981:103-345(-)
MRLWAGGREKETTTGELNDLPPYGAGMPCSETASCYNKGCERWAQKQAGQQQSCYRSRSVPARVFFGPWILEGPPASFQA